MSGQNTLSSERSVIHIAAFIAALCSFAYELIYSELLTVIYGGTVTQYGLTIGLFFSSLGIGSYLSEHFNDRRHENFFRTELYLAIVAPAGFLLIILVNTITLPQYIPILLFDAIARLPIIAIGILSGFELPLLLAMGEKTVSTEFESTYRKKIAKQASTVLAVIMGIGFHTDNERDAYTQYSTILAMDYVGGLAGALLFVFYLYPSVGLISSIFILALFNAVAALLFSLRFSTNTWGLLSNPSDRISLTENKTIFLICLLVTVQYGIILPNHQIVNEKVSSHYTESLIEQEYRTDIIETDVTEQYTTKYQQVTLYDRSWVGETENTLFSGATEKCMRLDDAIQLCESWIEPYHNGLVDVPLSTSKNSAETNVLLVGGGDWIAVDHLRDHNVTVEQVDIDGEFMTHMKNNSFVSPYHNDAYTYERLTTHQADIYTYLQDSTTTYDHIILDLPGAKSDDSLALYSTEFYTLLRAHLSNNGTVSTWAYSEYVYGNHNKALMNTLSDSGFESIAEYHAYGDYNGNGELTRGEKYILISPQESPTQQPINTTAGSHYVGQYQNRYEKVSWQPISTYDGISSNSIFSPNRKIIIPDNRPSRVGGQA